MKSLFGVNAVQPGKPRPGVACFCRAKPAIGRADARPAQDRKQHAHCLGWTLARIGCLDEVSSGLSRLVVGHGLGIKLWQFWLLTGCWFYVLGGSLSQLLGQRRPGDDNRSQNSRYANW
jgi:hypothetical protein